MSRDSRQLESVLHHDIPLTRDMGLKVLDWHDQQLRLYLPLDANVNHKSTMFGGSLYCGAVLAGWGWLHLRLQRRRDNRRAHRDSGRADQLSAAGDEGRYGDLPGAECDRCGRSFWRCISGMDGRGWSCIRGSQSVKRRGVYAQDVLMR